MRIALAGNPNTGKTSLFNALCRAGGHVGNYGGVTVERREGTVLPPSGAPAHKVPILVDLPGALSLTARSPDEAETQAVLLGTRGPPPDAVLYVLDATQLARGLYFCLQLSELGVPLLVALHRIDAARSRRIAIDVPGLAASLGHAVIACSAERDEGLDALKMALFGAPGPRVARFARAVPKRPLPVGLSAAEQSALAVLMAAIAKSKLFAVPPSESLALWLAGQQPGANLLRLPPPLSAALIECRQALAPYPAAQGLTRRSINARFGQVDTIVAAVERRTPTGPTPSSRLDGWLLSPVFGTVALLLAFFALFQLTFLAAEPVINGIEWATEAVAGVIGKTLEPGLLQSFLVDGLLAGLSNIAAFVPQIALLFFGLGLLEASGYMARAALLLDRIMRTVGLSGRAFVPLMSSFGCAIPGILATRSMDDRRQALRTMLVAPFMSCSARLPVYTLVISAVFSHLPPIAGVVGVGGLVMLAMYLLGIAAAFVSALLLGRFDRTAKSRALVMQMPDYAWPLWRSVARAAGARALQFVRGSGSTILLLSMLLWALLTFPNATPPADLCGPMRPAVAADGGSPPVPQEGVRVGPGGLASGVLPSQASAAAERQERMDRGAMPGSAQAASGPGAQADRDQCDALRRAYRLEHSAAGRLGHFIEPALRPLGFDWRIGIGLIASFAAREVLVSTLAQIYALAAPTSDDQAVLLRHALATERDAEGRLRFGVPEGLSLLVFFVLALQCLSTVGVLRRETGGWAWPIAALAYMNALAYVASLITYQSSHWLLSVH